MVIKLLAPARIDGTDFESGTVLDLDFNRARPLIRQGIAKEVPVSELVSKIDPQIERAVVKPAKEVRKNDS